VGPQKKRHGSSQDTEISARTEEFDKDIFLGSLRGFITEALIPVVKIIGKLHMPWTKKNVIHHYAEIMRVLKPGHVILSTTYGEISNIFNPGKYKHAILYVGVHEFPYGKYPAVIEATGEGVHIRPLFECLASKDNIAIMEWKLPYTANAFKSAMVWAFKQIGKGYDYRFLLDQGKIGMQNFYCSEYVYSFWHLMDSTNHFRLRKVMGTYTVIPDDFYKARSCWGLKYETGRPK